MSVKPPSSMVQVGPLSYSSSSFVYGSGSLYSNMYQQSQPYVTQPPPITLPSAPAAASIYPAPVPTSSPFPQYQQAQQLFERDAKIITPEALETVKAAIISNCPLKAETKRKAIPRKAAGQHWEDPTLSDWPENDSRLFCGDLGNEVNDDVLSKAFSRYPSFNMARVIRDKRTGKTKGYGFVSFSNPFDLAAALKEMNGKYVGNRPIKLRKSRWKDRIDHESLERQKKQGQRQNKPKPAKKNIFHK